MNRRQFLAGSLSMGAAVLATGGFPLFAAAATESPIMLEPLPYKEDALSPYISARTISFHYGKHYKGYVTKAVELLKGTALEKSPIEEIIRKTAPKPEMSNLFNNVSQVWNHAFYWKSMKPGGGGNPQGKLAQMIEGSFGSYSKFKDALTNAALTQFGSGWAWVVLDGGAVKITKTGNAGTPVALGQVPLLTIDVWEHAYYLDYQNRRPDYVAAFLDHLVNWDFAAANLAKTGK